MNPKLATALALAGGLAIALAAETAKADGWVLAPGSATYTYASPANSIFATLQVGGKRTAVAVQDSANNLSLITQTGSSVRALVLQGGASNTSFIMQQSHHSLAAVIQFGNPFSMLMGP